MLYLGDKFIFRGKNMDFLRKIAFVAFLTPFAFIQADVEEVIVTAN